MIAAHRTIEECDECARVMPGTMYHCADPETGAMEPALFLCFECGRALPSGDLPWVPPRHELEEPYLPTAATDIYSRAGEYYYKMKSGSLLGSFPSLIEAQEALREYEDYRRVYEASRDD